MKNNRQIIVVAATVIGIGLAIASFGHFVLSQSSASAATLTGGKSPSAYVNAVRKPAPDRANIQRHVFQSGATK